MDAYQKLQWLIVNKALEFLGDEKELAYPNENIGEKYESMEADPEECDCLYDAINEIRCSGFESLVEPPWSRHYESSSMASQLPDGTWVGWTYWYGGGNHGEPESMPWINDAYDVTCEKEIVEVHKFTKVESK